MDISPHNFSGLFDQLGLASDEAAIRRFIDEHSPLDPDLTLIEAPFWNPGQREFLRETLAEDSDWSELVEHLDAVLRR